MSESEALSRTVPGSGGPFAIFAVPPRVTEFLRYFLVSVVALTLDFSVLWVGVERGGWNYQWAAAAGFGIGVLVSYLLSVIFVFRQSQFGFSVAGFSRFFLVGLVGLLLNAALLQLLAGNVGLDYRIAKIFAAGISFLINYLWRYIWLFSADLGIKI